MLLAEQQGPDGLVILILEIDDQGRIGPGSRGQLQPRQLRSADRFRLNNFQVLRLDQEIRNLGVIGRIIVAFADSPQIVLFGEIDFISALLEREVADGIHIELSQKFLPHRSIAAGEGIVLTVADINAEPTKDDDEDDEGYELLAIHFAPVRLRLTKARARPEQQTRAGTAAMLA